MTIEMKKSRHHPSRGVILEWVALLSLAIISVMNAGADATEISQETYQSARSVNLSVGDLFTLHVSNLSYYSVADESLVKVFRKNDSNMLVVARRAGDTVINAWQIGASSPIPFNVHVGPREGQIELGAAEQDQTVVEEDYVDDPGWDSNDADYSEDDFEAGDTKQLTIYVGSVVTKDLGDVSRVVVGNEAIVKASTLDDGKLLLLGIGPGVSEMQLWTRDDYQEKYLVRVYPAPPSDPMRVISAVLKSYPNVRAENQLGTILLRGTVDALRWERFKELIAEFKGVINLVEPELNIAIENGIALDVSVLEISKKYQRTLGIRWQSSGAGPAFGVVGNLIPNNRFGVVSDTGDRDRLVELLGAVGSGTQKLSGYFGITSIIGSELQLLQEEGKAKVLAAPTLSTVSGEKATFLAGGELPISVLNQFGQPIVEFRQFGIQLEIEPIADRNMNIRSKIRAEVSDVDFGVVVNGVPGLRRRETTSTITARPGDTIVISGLLNASDSRNVSKLPGLGDIPILGRLFRSDDFVKQRTELIVTVTPRIQRANAPLGEEFEQADKQLRSVLTGSEKLDSRLME